MTSIAPKRFVILHHRVGAGFGRTDQDHFDWMFQTGPTLTTFATSVIGEMRTAIEVTCNRLPDHRIEYLDFEGPIPDREKQCDRGSVRRVVTGTFKTVENAPNCFSVTLSIDILNQSSVKAESTNQLPVAASVEFRLDSQRLWRMRYAPV